MKKFLLSLAAVALAGSAWAETAYLYVSANAPAGADSGNSVVPTGNVAGNTYSAGDVSFKFEKVNTNTSNVNTNLIRWYADDKIVITGKEGVDLSITAVKMTCSTTTYAKNVKVSDPSNISGTTSGSVFSVVSETGLSSITLEATAQTRFSVLEVTYMSSESGLENPNLSFEKEAYTVNLGENFDAPILNNQNNLVVAYSSSNEEVATIDNEGIVTIIGAGTTEIKATSEKTDKFKAGEAKYTLSVIDPDALDATFDFVNNTYGLERLSGQTSSYNPDPTTIKEELITLTLEGNTRLWKDGMRFYKNSKMIVTIDNGYKIISITTGSGDFTVNGNVIECNVTSGNTPMNTLTISYSKDNPTSVDTINIDTNAPKEYYNLQGVRVANPEKGLYIVRQGGKVSKVIL